MEEHQDLISLMGAHIYTGTDRPIILCDSEGTIISANPAALDFFNFGPSAGEKKWPNALSEVLREENSNTDKLNVIEDIIRTEQSRKINFIVSTAHVSDITYEIQFYPLKDREADYVGIALIDRTPEVRLSQNTTDFISLTSHQMRTPLSAIKWYIDLYEHKYKKSIDKEQRRIIGNIGKSNQRMISLVDMLLEISHIETGQVEGRAEKMKVSELVTDLIDELKPEIIKKKIEIVTSLHSGLNDLRVDPVMLKYVFMNLLNNAIMYSKQGGEVDIFLSRKGDDFLVQVTDYGVGIAKQDQYKLFTKFFRANNAKKASATGSGLGLYLAKNIIETYGGSIWFKSDKNKGTTFWFSLPIDHKTGIIGKTMKNRKITLYS